MSKPLALTTLRNVALAGIYIFGISQFLFYGERIFPDGRYENLIPFMLLLLLSLSAAVVGSLIFGQSVMLFLENKKSESILSAIYSVGWLFGISLVAVAVVLLSQ